jgi:hypothetical protein
MPVPCVLAGLLVTLLFGAAPYPWPHADTAHALAQDIVPPAGYARTKEPEGSFGDWLRRLPVRPRGTPVRLFDGRLKANQTAQARVIDIDVGNKDHQQCADAVIRLRAEYLYASGKGPLICFRATNGTALRWSDWAAGARPRVAGNKILWRKTAADDPSWPSFRRFLDFVFVYAGTYSLARELIPVAPNEPIRPGDVFIQGGFPGHAVMVVDVAENPKGRQLFLLAQSYMPAQDIHVLRGTKQDDPWYRFPVGEILETPEWTFSPARRMRFQDASCGK